MANGDRTLLNLLGTHLKQKAQLFPEKIGAMTQAYYNANPLAIAGKAIGQLAATATTPIPEGQSTGQFIQQQGQQFGQQVLRDILDPIKKVQQKEVEKLAKQQVQEAAQAGVPIEEIQTQISTSQPAQSTQQPQAQQYSDPFQPNTPEAQQVAQALAGGAVAQPLPQEMVKEELTQPAPPPRISINEPKGPLGMFQQRGMSIDAEGNITIRPGGFFNLMGSGGLAQQASTAKVLQELAGVAPLQEGEREKAGIELQADILKEVIKLDNEGNLKPNEIFNKFEAASGEFIKARDSHARVIEAAKDPSAAGDLALIFNYMKVLDPGSTVREGEFANAQNSAGIPQRIRAAYNSVINGKRLSKVQRKDFVDRSGRLFNAFQKQQTKTTDEFSRLAKKNGLDPDRLIRDVGLSVDPNQQSTIAGVKEAIAQARAKGAVTIDDKTGKFYDAQGNEVK